MVGRHANLVPHMLAADAEGVAVDREPNMGLVSIVEEDTWMKMSVVVAAVVVELAIADA